MDKQLYINNLLMISIHALLAESDIGTSPSPQLTVISIHALLAESDSAANFSSGKSITISIHALLAESDCCARFRCWA